MHGRRDDDDHGGSPGLAAQEELYVERTIAPDHTILAVAGEIDLLTAPAFDAAIDEALAADDRDLWIDLTGVTFLGSPVLHSLIRASRLLERMDRKGIVICPEGGPRRILRISGVERAITVVADRRSAGRAHLRRRSGP